VKPVKESVFMSDEELARERSLQHEILTIHRRNSGARQLGWVYWRGWRLACRS
jgi:hypothetical protein